jgi:hypothetical protein
MRRAFVLRIAADCDLDKGEMAGLVEEVDTGRELKFQSVAELVRFVSQCIKDRAAGSGAGSEGRNE